jgi:hypothetical protein
VDGGVVVEGEGLTPGDIVPVTVTGSSAYDLFARAQRRENLELHILGGRQ